MGGKQRPEAGREKHVRGFRRFGRFQFRAICRGDTGQGSSDPAGIAGELHGRRIGKKLPLPADGRLDQAAEEGADVADDHQREAQQQDRGDCSAALLVARAATASARCRDPHRVVAEQPQHEDPVHDGDQAKVEPHVAMQDVAKLVGHDALQLVAGELLGSSSGDADHGRVDIEPSGEGVDARLAIEQVNRRHGCA